MTRDAYDVIQAPKSGFTPLHGFIETTSRSGGVGGFTNIKPVGKEELYAREGCPLPPPNNMRVLGDIESHSLSLRGAAARPAADKALEGGRQILGRRTGTMDAPR